MKDGLEGVKEHVRSPVSALPKPSLPSANKVSFKPSFGRTGKEDHVGNNSTQIAALKQQVALLEADIAQRVEDETRMQRIQNQLRERLEVFQQQNEENVARAEQEMLNLHKQIKHARSEVADSHKRVAKGEQELRKSKEEHEAIEARHRLEKDALLDEVSPWLAHLASLCHSLPRKHRMGTFGLNTAGGLQVEATRALVAGEEPLWEKTGDLESKLREAEVTSLRTPHHI